MKLILIGTLTYVVLTIVMGVGWNLVLFHDLYTAISGPGRRGSPIMPLGIASMLIEGVALSVLFSRLYHGQSTMLDAVTIAMLVGVFSIGYAALVVPAKFTIAPVWKYVALEVAFGVLHFGAVGIMFSHVFKR